MKNIFYFSLLLLLLSFKVFSQNIEQEALIFEKYEKSTVFISNSLFFSSSDVENRKVFEKIEKHYDIKILDEDFIVSSGTGFIITSDGKLLTNNHVTEVGNIDELRDAIYKKSITNFFGKIPVSLVSYNEYEDLKRDLRNMIEKSKFRHKILVNNQKTYYAASIATNDKIDAALLKIDSSDTFEPVPVGDSDLLKVGNFVMSIGYPVPDSLFSAVKDFKSTMTSGIVSALRNDNWGIQHTSAISPGNSGGPLFNKKGEVVGINVGAVTTGNDLFFSIPVNKIIKWLQTTNYSSALEQNRREAIGFGEHYKLNSDGYLEIGSSILVNLPKGYQVYIDNKYKGTTPIFLENLKQGNATLKIVSDNEYLNQKILVKKQIDNILTYQPILNKFTGKLFVNSTPNGASVFIDNKKVGSTPFVLNKITIGEHSIKINKSGYASTEERVIVQKGKTRKINASLNKAYKIIFNASLPKNTNITVSNKNITYEYSENEVIELPKGIWNIVIENNSFKTETISVTIENSDKKLDFKPSYYTGTLKLTNLQEESKVFIDNQPVFAQIESDNTMTISLKSGKHEVRVEKTGYITYKNTIEIEKSEMSELYVTYKSEKSLYYNNSGKYLAGAITLDFFAVLFIGGGIGAFVGGIYLMDDPENLYSEHMLGVLGGVGLTVLGTLLGIVGGTFIIISVPLYSTYSVKRKSYRKKLTLNASITDNFNLYLKYIF